ncbi:hypothetical protein D3C74_433280 [compost metagenome]
MPAIHNLPNPFGQRCDGRVGKQINDRNLKAERLFQNRFDPYQCQGRSSQLKKVIMNADVLDSQKLLPNLCDLLLQMIGRLLVFSHCHGTLPFLLSISGLHRLAF